MYLMKYQLVLWRKSKFLSMCTLYLKDRAAVEVENKWVDSLNILDEVDWNNIHKGAHH